MVEVPPNPDWYDARFDPYLIQVGRIATMWGDLEFAVNQSIWELANVEPSVGACLTAQLVTIGSRMRALLALLHFRDAEDELLKEFSRLDNKIEGLGRQRNRWVHDPVALGRGGELRRIHVTADKRLDYAVKDADLVEMHELHVKIREASLEFRALYKKARDALPPWPRTQFEQAPRSILSVPL